MNHIKYHILFFFCLILLLLYITECKNINNKLEKFNINLDDNYNDKLKDKLNFFLNLAGGGTINTNTLYILNNLSVNNLTVNNGSDFFGETHYFYSKNGGKLKIGSIDGLMGIYSDDGKDMYLKSDTNFVKINNNLIVKDAYKKV